MVFSIVIIISGCRGEFLRGKGEKRIFSLSLSLSLSLSFSLSLSLSRFPLFPSLKRYLFSPGHLVAVEVDDRVGDLDLGDWKLEEVLRERRSDEKKRRSRSRRKKKSR